MEDGLNRSQGGIEFTPILTDTGGASVPASRTDRPTLGSRVRSPHQDSIHPILS